MKSFILIAVFLVSSALAGTYWQVSSIQGSIGCYSRTSNGQFGLIGQNIELIGQIPMDGSYSAEGVFEPTGFEGQDISALQHFKDLCNTQYPFCNNLNGCWAEGNTLSFAPNIKTDFFDPKYVEESSYEEEESFPIIPAEEEEYVYPPWNTPTYEEESIYLPVYVPSTPGSGSEEEFFPIPAEEEEYVFPPWNVPTSEEESIYLPIYVPSTPVVASEEEVIAPEEEEITPPTQGYIACYAHSSDEEFVSVGNNIRVIGYISLEGAYDAQGIFQPKNEDQDFSALCNTHYPFCDDLNGCWAGGDTLGYNPSFEEEQVVAPEEEVIAPEEEEITTPTQGSIACYAHGSDEGFTSVGNNIRVIGYISLEGAYDAQGIFQPKGFEGQDISVLQHFKDLCNTHYPFCDDLNGCWAGGDTLGYNPSFEEEQVVAPEEEVIAPEEEEITTPTQGSIACYAHGSDEGFTSVGNNIRVIGYISLEGAYDAQGIFQPKGFEGQDISVLQHFKDLCNTHYPFCDDLNGCWAGGDTLGYNPSFEEEQVITPEEEEVEEEEEEEETVVPEEEEITTQGYIACYAHNYDDGFMSAGNDIQVVGYIPLDGSYDSEGIFEPKGFEGQDISALQHFKDLCNTHYPFCDDLNGCWAGGV